MALCCSLLCHPSKDTLGHHLPKIRRIFNPYKILSSYSGLQRNVRPKNLTLQPNAPYNREEKLLDWPVNNFLQPNLNQRKSSFHCIHRRAANLAASRPYHYSASKLKPISLHQKKSMLLWARYICKLQFLHTGGSFSSLVIVIHNPGLL